MRWLCSLSLAALLAAGAQAQPVPDTLWTRLYPEWDHTSFHAILAVPEGGYIVAGQREVALDTNNIQTDIRLAKLDAEGDVLWTELVSSGVPDTAFYPVSLHATEDDGFLLLARKRYLPRNCDVLLMRCDGDGTLLWQQTYGSQDFQWADVLSPTPDGNYVITAYTQYPHPTIPNWFVGGINLLKVNGVGELLWNRDFWFAGGDLVPNYTLALADGDLLISYGRVVPNYEWGHLELMRVNSEGEEEWTTFWTELERGACKQIIEREGDLVLAGATFLVENQNVVYEVSFSPEGEFGWMQQCPASGGLSLHIAEFTERPDGALQSVGWAQPIDGDANRRHLFLMQTDADGQCEWRLERALPRWSHLWCATTGPAGEWYVAGSAPLDGAAQFCPYLVKIGATPSSSAPVTAAALPGFSLAPCYPNPFNAQTEIVYTLPVAAEVSLVIYDALGREITTLVSAQQGPGLHRLRWDASGVSSGTYFCRLEAGGAAQTRKLLLTK